jgi:hypothetical protein
MDARPTTPTFEVDIDDDRVAFFHENGYLAIERVTTDEEVEWLRSRFDELFAYANEYQIPPVKRDVPADRPWVGEGRRAFEARSVFQP